MQTLDAALDREFPISETLRFRLRGEFFKRLNHTNLGTPNRFVNTPQFGTITESATPNRELQLSVRLSGARSKLLIAQYPQTDVRGHTLNTRT